MLMNYIHAFWVGGLICALVQILLDKTRLMPGRVMVLLVCTGSVLSALHLYEPLVDYAGAGASVPLIGFGHLLFQGVKEEMEQVGVLGVFTGGLKASACQNRHCSGGSVRAVLDVCFHKREPAAVCFLQGIAFFCDRERNQLQ